MINKRILNPVHYHGFSEDELYGSYKIFFGTLVSESRLKIINLLRNGSKNVGQIVSELKMDQSAVSHDLNRLKRCGFVKSTRDGKFVYYQLNEDTLRPLMGLIEKHMLAYCVHILHGADHEKD